MWENLLGNRFVQSLGVGTLVYLLLWSLNWVILFALRTLESFSQWYRYHAAPYTLQISAGMTLFYLVTVAVFSSRRD